MGQILLSSHSTNKRGLIHKNLPFTATASFKDTEGKYILGKGVLHGENILLVNNYAPNEQDIKPFTQLYLVN